MNCLLKLFTSFLLLYLAGCSKNNQITIKDHKNKSCIAHCIARFDSCKNLCKNNCSRCSFKNHRSAENNFLNYLHEVQIEGGYITRRLNSYRDPLQCRKVSCSCQSDLMTCEQNCTGLIHKQLGFVPHCI